MSTPPTIAICAPYYRHFEGPTALCMLALGLCSGPKVSAMPIEAPGAYIEDNRNGYVQYALDTGVEFDWLLSIDSDMIFPPDALLRFLADDPPERFKEIPQGWVGRKDIVGANYRTRKPPHVHAAHYVNASGDNLMKPGLWPMTHLPTGLLLTKFEIFRKLPYPWFKPGLRGEERDDVYFCNRAREAGYEIWCDHDVSFQVKHRDVYDIPWFTPEQLVPVEENVDIRYQKIQAEARMRALLAGRIAKETPPSAGARTGADGVSDPGGWSVA